MKKWFKYSTTIMFDYRELGTNAPPSIISTLTCYQPDSHDDWDCGGHARSQGQSIFGSHNLHFNANIHRL
jgi:hypothetical protein